MAALIELKNLKKYFSTPKGMLHAVDDVTLTIEEGTTLGVVGESGCGKSTLGRTVIHLLESTDGQIFYRGEDVTHVSKKKLSELRHEQQFIFQDPNSSLDPRKSIESTLREPLKYSVKLSRKEINEKVNELMELVGIDHRMRRAYPHELDGGRRQRVGIARALAMDPKFIVCDEPVSALDVSIQAQILNLLQDLQEKKGLTYMFITHDMSVVKHLSDSICVMYLGQVIEHCATKDMFSNPLHPYTQVLLSAIPTIDLNNQKKHNFTRGEITSPINPKPGCRFAARCAYYSPACEEPQTLKEVLPGHHVACCRVKELISNK